MDRTTRGNLLVEKEIAENRVYELREEMGKTGTMIENLGKQMSSAPDSIQFTNLPPAAVDENDPPVKVALLDWTIIPDKAKIAAQSREMRKLQVLLKTLKEQLSEPLEK